MTYCVYTTLHEMREKVEALSVRLPERARFFQHFLQSSDRRSELCLRAPSGRRVEGKFWGNNAW